MDGDERHDPAGCLPMTRGSLANPPGRTDRGAATGTLLSIRSSARGSRVAREPRPGRPSGQRAEVLATVRRTMRRHGMLDGVDRLGVAVSGGADSLTMLDLLAEIVHDGEGRARNAASP